MRGSAPDPKARIHYLDTLKVAVVYGIVFYHAALPFTWTSWLISNPQKSFVLTAFTAFCFPWGIPMMFLLAGADSWFALRSRPPLVFVRDRFLRLVLPLAAGIALLSPLQWYLTSTGIEQRSLEALLRSYPRYFDEMRLSWTPEWLGRYGYHLWFLGYLFGISVVLLPVLLLLRKQASRRLVAAAAAFSCRPGALYVFALPLIVSQVALRDRFPAYQDWADIATYFLVFLAGYLLASERRLEQAIRSNVRIALVVGSLSGLGVVGLIALGGTGIRVSGLRTIVQMVYATLWAVNIWSWIIAVLHLGIRWLDFGNRAVDYLAESILPFYVISHPFVLFTASIAVTLPLGVWPKFALVACSSLAATMAVYELLVRRWRVTRVVFGLKPRPPRRPASSSTSASGLVGTGTPT